MEKKEDAGGGERARSWYLSKEDIERGSPSRRDGVDASKEAQLRGIYCSFIRDVGIRLKLPQITIATGILLCHRFYLHQSHAKNEWQTVATVCMFLATKIEDTPRPLERVVVVAHETMYRKNPDAARRILQKELLEKRKALILVGEALLLSTIRFDFNIQHPYEPLKLAIKNLGISQKEVKQAALNYVNDTLRTTLVIQFKPHYIAAGSLYLAAKKQDVHLPSEKGNIWWHQFDVAPKQLEDVIQQMKHLFLKTKACSTGAAINPTPKPTPAPTPTLVEKQLTVSFPEPVLRHTYSRRCRSRPSSTAAPMEKHQLISTPDSVLGHTTSLISNDFDEEASRCMPLGSLAPHSSTVSSASNVDHKPDSHHTLNRATMVGTSEKQSSQTASMEKHHTITTPDHVLGRTHPSRTSLIRNNFDTEASRCMPVDSSARHDSAVSPARNGDNKSRRTHMDRSLNSTAMGSRSEKQSSRIVPMEKQPIISTQESVLRRTQPSRTCPVSNDSVREASRCMLVDRPTHLSSTVSSASNGDHKSLQTNIHYRLTRTTMDERSDKQSSQIAPMEQQCTISTLDPALEHTHFSRTSRTNINFDTKDSRSIHADSSTHHDSTVSSAKNGDNKSLRTDMDRSSKRTAMDRRIEKQSTRTASVEKQRTISTPDPALEHIHFSRTSLTSNSFDTKDSRYAPADNLAYHDSTVSSGKSGDNKSLRTHMDCSLNRTAMDRRSEKQSTRTAPVEKQRTISTPDSVLSHTHPSRTCLSSKKFDCEASRRMPVDSLSHQDATVSSARNGDHSSLPTHIDRSLNRTASERRSEKQSSRSAPVEKQHIISNPDPVQRHTHPSRTSLISNNSDRYKPVESLAQHDSTVSRNGDHKSLQKHIDHSLNRTAVNGRPEKQSSRAGLKADHVYHVCSGPKDVNVARVTEYLTKKRRIQEVEEHPTPVDKCDNGAWVGKRLRSIVVVETKEPSWKKQKI